MSQQTSDHSSSAAPSTALLDAIAGAPAPAGSDKVDALRAECERLRADDLLIKDLTERLETLTAQRLTRVRETVPDLMDQVGVTELALATSGNSPAVTIKVKPYYKAVIAADWPDEQKQAAFNWLDANNCGDLIKTNVTVPFAREDRELALEAVAILRKNGFTDIEIGQSVHFMTLTSWLKNRCEENVRLQKKHAPQLPLPPLDLIGAIVGRVAEIKPVKEK